MIDGIGAELSELIEAAFIVQRTYQSIDGERERAIDGFERMADGIRAACAADSDVGVNAYLSTIAKTSVA